MNSSVDTVVRDALKGRLLLTHPFYRRWEQGGLTREELARYAEQYRFFEAFLPEFLGELAERLDDGDARDAVVGNLSDEIGVPSHLELFDRFASAYGAQSAKISPAMATLVDAYSNALGQGVSVAMAALVAYELQGADIARSKHDGLVRHYQGAADALEFWAVHGDVELEHANWTMDGLTSLAPDEADVRRGVELVAAAWWHFLDERDALALI